MDQPVNACDGGWFIHMGFLSAMGAGARSVLPVDQPIVFSMCAWASSLIGPPACDCASWREKGEDGLD